MKKVILILLATAITASAQLVFDATVTGTPTSFDLEAATMVVEEENARRTALDPPEDPLPTGTNIQLRDSYLTIIIARIEEIHANYVRTAALRDHEEKGVKDLWKNATPAQRQAAITALGGS